MKVTVPQIGNIYFTYHIWQYWFQGSAHQMFVSIASYLMFGLSSFLYLVFWTLGLKMFLLSWRSGGGGVVGDGHWQFDSFCLSSEAASWLLSFSSTGVKPNVTRSWNQKRFKGLFTPATVRTVVITIAILFYGVNRNRNLLSLPLLRGVNRSLHLGRTWNNRGFQVG